METPWYKQKTFWGIILTTGIVVLERLFNIMPNPTVYNTLLTLFVGFTGWGIADKVEEIKTELKK